MRTCIGCGKKYEVNPWSAYYYDNDETHFCPTCRRKPINAPANIVVEKEDLELLKALLK